MISFADSIFTRPIAVLLACTITFGFSSRPLCSDFSFESKKNNTSTFWLPFLSLNVPGAAQFAYQHYDAMFLYGAIGVTGLGLALSGIEGAKDNMDEDTLFDFDRDEVKRYVLGAKTYEFAGELSLYQGFRTAVKQMQAQGDYTFLTKEETTPELMMAPFDFSHLNQWTTLIPVGLAAGILAATVSSENYKAADGGDLLFTSALSYEAGVGEELMFRGWIQPLLYENIGNSAWANVIQASLFAAAHISEVNSAPIPQWILGYYFGYLVEKRGWSLKEAIFIHTWWDVFVFAAALSYEDTADEASIQVPLFVGSF